MLRVSAVNRRGEQSNERQVGSRRKLNMSPTSWGIFSSSHRRNRKLAGRSKGTPFIQYEHDGRFKANGKGDITVHGFRLTFRDAC